MAIPFKDAAELYRKTVREVGRDSKSWKAFLSTAAFQYKYSFDDQIMIHAQRPHAIACAEIELWNKHFGRRVKKGSTGIALISESVGHSRLRYVYDVGDTYSPDRQPFSLWEIAPTFEGEIIEALENRFGNLSSKDSLSIATMFACMNAVEDNLTDYLENLKQIRIDSALEPLSEEELKVKMSVLLTACVVYTVFTRLGMEAEETISDHMIFPIAEFNTDDTVSILGVANADISELCLRQIEKTVRSCEKEKASGTRTFDKTPQTAYNKAEKQPEQGGKEHGTDLQNRERHEDPRPDAALAAQGRDWEVRTDAAGVPQSPPQGDLRRDESQRHAEAVSSGDRPDRKGDGGEADRRVSESRGLDRADEERGSSALDRVDEQLQDGGGGNGVARSDPRLTESAPPKLPAPDGEIIIESLRHDKYLREAKYGIVSFLRSEPNPQKKTEYIKSVYPMDTFIEFYKKGSEEHIGYHPTKDYLEIYFGKYLTHTHEVKFSWDKARQLIEALIKDNNYLDGPEPGQQLSILDEVKKEEVPATRAQLRVSQEVIDNLLRLGGCTRKSAQRIYGFYRRANNQAENVAFLKREYETDAIGMIIDDRKVSAKWDEKGIRISQGEYVSDEYSAFLPWETVDQRIRELLEMGQYLPQVEAEQAEAVWDDHVSEKITTLYREEFGNIPSEYKTQLERASWDEQKALYISILKNPPQLLSFLKEIQENGERIKDYPPRYRVWRKPEDMYALAATYLRDPVDFPPSDPHILPPKRFTTRDQIDRQLIEQGSSFEHGKYRIYSYFLMHKDPKERAKFLSDEYGTGGASGGRIGNDHSSKGLVVFGGLGRGDSAAFLKWNQVAKRIDELIREDKYMTDKEIANLDNYEKWQLTRYIQSVFELQIHDAVHAKRDEMSAYDAEKQIKAQIMAALDNPESAEKIVAIMQQAYDELPEHKYNRPYRKVGLDAMIAYSKGKYNLFPGSHFRKTVIRTVTAEEAPSEQDAPVIADKKITDEYDLHLGTEVRIGTTECIINSMSEEMVELFDGTLFPLELDTATFLKRLRENPLNDHLKKQVEQAPKAISPKEPSKEYDSPIWRTYRQLKKEFPESIAFVGVGDFYEFFEDDAETVAKVLELTMTSRSFDGNTRIPMCGIPKHAADGYIRKLIDAGYKLAIDGGEVPPEIPKQMKVEETVAAEPEDAEIEREAENAPAFLSEPTKPQKIIPVYDSHPHVYPEDKHNYRITDDAIGMGGEKEKFRKNIAAIKCLQNIERYERVATPEEQEILAQYSGWGGLADAFDSTKENWKSEYQELKDLLSAEEYTAARASTLTAFYTPPVVIKAIYQALGNMGFKQGNVLEPSCGVGNFMGLVPDGMTPRMYGVELERLSGRIARQLYQKNGITIDGYEKTEFPDSFFDVAVGNVPFGDFKLTDRRYDKHNFLVHDYFFAKTLDKVRPGGIITFVTSSGTMDKENPAIRKYLAQRADLIGAIRLPNNTFNGAGAKQVVSDILFLQKRDRIIEAEPDWVHLGKTDNDIPLNQYFLNHPEMVLGKIEMRSGQYGPEPTCRPFEGKNLEELLRAAVANLQAEIPEIEREEPENEEDDGTLLADPRVKNFSYTLVGGKVYYRQNSIMTPVETSVTGENRIKGMIGLRETTRELIEAQLDNQNDGDIRVLQERLNIEYDAFAKKYGRINSRANSAVFSEDNSYFLLCSLEVLSDKGEFERKADMFHKRTIKPNIPIDRVDMASEALALSIGEKAEVDMEYMSGLTGKSEDELYADLSGVIFLNPQHQEGGKQTKYLMADEYLSGNVRAKLNEARILAEKHPDLYSIHVESLERVQPQDLQPTEIGVRLGSTWIPQEDVEAFVYHLMGTPAYMKHYIGVKYIAATAQWHVTGKSMDHGVNATNVYGTLRINAYEIIEDTLNLKDVRVMDYVEDEHGNVKPVLNKKETTIAQGKQDKIKRAFEEWIWSDSARRERLCRLYNEKFNSIRPRTYDGSHIRYFGMNPEITLRKHQTDAVARIMYGGNTLLAHVVGAGKTYTMVAAAQEGKRLGLCSKSMFVVPNHLVGQWATEYLQLYPSANILVTTKKDFETRNRKKFCARIATGDYDAVIIGQSQFEKLPVSLARQLRMIEGQIEELEYGIAELQADRGERYTVKQLERAKKKLEQKLEKLTDRGRKDDVICFEELGVDRLFVDEAHYYKNLFVYSKMRNVAGISQTEAQKSTDLYMKGQYLDDVTDHRGMIFATGTPISNSMVELFTMQRYLQSDTLKLHGLSNFDEWASTFGETVTAIELSPDGSGYRPKTRFAKFFNIPELMSMFREVADVQTADMLNLPVPKANFHIEKAKPSEYQKAMVQEFAKRAAKVHAGIVKSFEDNMLLITNDGRKLALDQRLMNPDAPDYADSKVNLCVQNVYEIWEKTKDQRSAQLVFCDLSTPKGKGFQMIEDVNGEYEIDPEQFTNVYDDLRRKLIAKGIPAEEIAYIHHADTDVKKKELFAKVRSGQVRVLLGSTFKMGAGTNVQKRLIALHDLDVPWRPSDLEQRAGRIVRQGNENDEVHLYRYITEGTFDAYSYQLLESKQKFISQIMTSKLPVRIADDMDDTALSYAEIKALASGNPKIMEKMQLDTEVAKLKVQKADHLSSRYALEDKLIRTYPQKMADLKAKIVGCEADHKTVAENTFPNDKGFSPMVVMGQTYTEKEDAGKAILAVKDRLTTGDPRPLGEYRGLKTEIGYEKFWQSFYVALVGKIRTMVKIGDDANGLIVRLNNAIDSMSAEQQTYERELAALEKEIERTKAEIDKPFALEKELEEKLQRLSVLNAELSIDKPENELVDEAEEPTEDEQEQEQEQEEEDREGEER